MPRSQTLPPASLGNPTSPTTQCPSQPACQPSRHPASNLWKSITNPLAPFGGGIKAAGFDLIRFLTLNSHCYSAIRLCLSMSLEDPSTTRSVSPDPEPKIRYNTKNRLIFDPVFKVQETRKTVPKALKKQFPSKVIFWNILYPQTTIWESRTSAIDKN